MHISKRIWFAAAPGLLLVVVLVFAGRPAAAQEAPAPVASLPALVGELIRSNPDIKAASARHTAALQRPSIEGSLPDPKASFGWMSPTYPVPGRGLGVEPTASVNLQVGQELPYPGKLALKSNAARKEAENTGHMYDAVVRRKVAELKQAFYDLGLAERTTLLLRENQESLRQLSKVAQARYTVGQGMQQDLIKAGTEVSILDNRLIALDQQKRSLSAQINALLGRPWSGVPLQVVLPAGDDELPGLEPLESLQSRLKQSAPMLLAQQSMIDTRKVGVEVARKDYYPDFDLMTGYYYQGSMPNMWEVRVGVSIPVFYKRKQQREVALAAAELNEAAENYRSAEQSLNYQLQDAYARADTARKLADLYNKQILPQSRLALESSLTSYQTGAVDFLTVFSNFNMTLDYRMSLYEQQAEYLKALATIEELTGGEVQS